MLDRMQWQERHDEPELLDQGVGSLQDVQINLAEMWRINRHLGGLRALTYHLFPRLRQHTREKIVIADIGCGGANLGMYLVQWAEQNQISLQMLSVDISARNLSIAHHNTAHIHDVYLLQADAVALPFDHVDYVISSLFLHHFAPVAVINLLQKCYISARCSILMTDIVRAWMSAAAFRLVQPMFARHYLTRYDGMLSIRRAYQPEELLKMAIQAGLHTAHVYAHFPWRMTLVADK